MKLKLQQEKTRRLLTSADFLAWLIIFTSFSAILVRGQSHYANCYKATNTGVWRELSNKVLKTSRQTSSNHQFYDSSKYITLSVDVSKNGLGCACFRMRTLWPIRPRPYGGWRARDIFYWPSMTFDIECTVVSCKPCNSSKPHQLKELLLVHPIPDLHDLFWE